jgi:hypothetical protein
MPFDWSAYRTVAETLKDDADEASQRSAISRAYYCAYHQALNHLAEHHSFLRSRKTGRRTTRSGVNSVVKGHHTGKSGTKVTN